jgi:outer membrane protein assembly factor BamB
MWGSTLVADGKVYTGDEDGDFVILAASREKKLLFETNLNAPIHSTPIMANGVLYVASNSHLFAIADLDKQAATAAGR